MVAIPSSTRSVTYSPVASTGPFPIPFPVFDEVGDDLRVTLDGVEVAGWTFAGTLESGFYGAPNTWINGNITFAVPISGVLLAKGMRAPRRQAQFAEGRGIPARDHNAEYSILTAVDQELRRDIDEIAVDLDLIEESVATAVEAAAIAVAAADAADDRYLGDKTVPPTTDNDGDPLVIGTRFFLKDQVDPLTNGEYRWFGLPTGWQMISILPVAFERVEDVFVDASMVASGVVTVPGGYVPGVGLQAQRNGAGLKPGPAPGLGAADDDYTATNGTTAVFAATYLVLGDWLRFSIKRPYSPAATSAADVDFVPAAGIAATNTQSAIEELAADVAAADALLLPKAGGTLTGPLILAADPTIALHAATKQYVDQIVAAQDAMVFKGIIDCSANPNYPAADRGWTYRVSVAGKIGGASGANVEAGDILICLTDGTVSGTQAAVGAQWGVIQVNIDGAVTLTGTQTLTNKSLTSPILTGTPTAPTPAFGTNTDQIATMAAIQAALAGAGAVGLQLISSGSNPGASLDIALGTTYRRFILKLRRFEPVTNAAFFRALIATDGVPNYLATANYSFAGTFSEVGNATGGQWQGTASEFQFSSGQLAAAGNVGNFDIEIENAGPSAYGSILWRSRVRASTGSVYRQTNAGAEFVGNADRWTHIQFKFSSGNIGSAAGWALYGLKE